MALLVFDLGGTSVKYGVWHQDEIHEASSFKTPSTWEEMKAELLNVKLTWQDTYDFEGVAFSSPGVVNQEKRMIEGISAIPYTLHFPIYDELEALFDLRVSFENDANCVALAEVWQGAAKGLQDVILVVIGTGIGGSIILDGKLRKSPNLFSGEFGYAFLDGDHTFSELGTAVNMATRYEKRLNLPKGSISGEDIFRLAEEENHPIAIEEVELFFHYLAKGLHNLFYTLDPEMILIGGGISNRPHIIENIHEGIEKLYAGFPDNDFPLKINLATCHFRKDANLIGAVYNYKLKHPQENDTDD